MTGCKPDEKAVISRQVREYMAEKYGDVEYEEYTVRLSQALENHDTFVGYLPGDNPKTDYFNVRRYYDKDARTYIFDDDFYGKMLRADFEAMARETVDKYFPGCLMYGSVRARYSQGNDISFEGAVRSNSIEGVGVWVILDESSYPSETTFCETSESFSQEWASLELDSMLYIEVVSPAAMAIWEEKGRSYCSEGYRQYTFGYSAHTANGKAERR